jgi:CBS domain-containing protein
LTEHDVTVRVAAPGRDPTRTRLEQVMTPNPVTLQTDDPLAWALHRMGVDGYRHLPVLDGQRLVGFLSVRTVLRVLQEA